MRVFGLSLVVVMVSSLAGAQTPPAPQVPSAAPARATAAAMVKVTWQQALDRALTRNASTLVALQEIERASALVREARAGWLPSLNGNGTYVRLDSARTFGGNTPTPISQWNGNLALTVPLLAPTAWANDVHAQDNR